MPVSFFEVSMLIYKITNKINGKCYIGQTSGSLKHRIQQHRKSKSHCTALRDALRIEGMANFDFEILRDNITDRAFANILEVSFIKQFNSKFPNGYNLTDGGRTGPGYKHSLESKKLIAKVQKDGYAFRSLEGTDFGRTKAKAIKCSNGTIYFSIREAALAIGTDRSHIRNCLAKPTRTIKGFKFEYIEDI
jgi:group I intron endonuclease